MKKQQPDPKKTAPKKPASIKKMAAPPAKAISKTQSEAKAIREKAVGKYASDAGYKATSKLVQKTTDMKYPETSKKNFIKPDSKMRRDAESRTSRDFITKKMGEDTFQNAYRAEKEKQSKRLKVKP